MTNTTATREPNKKERRKKFSRPNYRQPGAPVASQYGMTLEEIALCMGVTRERVRQIEAQALFKLRKILQSKGLNPNDFFID